MVEGTHGPAHMHPANASTLRCSGAGGRCGSDVRCCRVPGCTEPLAPGYHSKYRICRHHCQLASQEVDGETVRFCQQCGRFQGLDEFDAARRSCRASLSQHKQRRRLAKQHAEDERHSEDAPADEGAAEGNGKRGRQPAGQEEQPHSRQKAAPQQPRQPQPVLPAKLPCPVYVAPLQPLQPLPQPPPGHWASRLQAPPQPLPGHWASSVRPPAHHFGLPPAMPGEASGAALPAVWWCLATASHSSGSARVLLQPVAPAVPRAAGKGAPAGLCRSPSPAHQAASGPGIGMLPLPAPLADPQAVHAAMSIIETSSSFETILAFDADLGLDLGSQWGQPPAGAPGHPGVPRKLQKAQADQAPQRQPQQQEDAHEQPQQQQADCLQLPSRWGLAGPQAAPAQAEQPCHFQLAGSSGVRSQPAAAALPAHTANSADSMSAAQLQALWQFASAVKQGADAQPLSAQAAPAGTAARHNLGTAKAQRRCSPHSGPSQPGPAVVQAQAVRAAPAAPPPSVRMNYRPVALCPASVCPDMCSPPRMHPDDRLYLQQLSLSLSEGSLPLEFQSSASLGYGEYARE